jgi:recombination protein RecR
MNGRAPEPVERLIEALARLPGIGPKTASRLAYYLLRAPEQESTELADAVERMRTETRLCSVCFNITAAGVDPCRLCSQGDRDRSQLCVVEEPLDVLALERTGVFHGLYHVLHGALSPLEGIGPDDLRIHQLFTRLEAGEVRELILATNPTLEGEATAMYLKNQLEGSNLAITRLARGLPSGGDLEYADLTTLSQALSGRSQM